MSIRLQNEVEQLRREIDVLKLAVSALSGTVAETTRLLEAMTRASTPKGKAA